MKLPLKTTILFLVLLVSFTSTLVAANVRASYTEHGDTTIQNASDFGITNIPGINVALHVGTLIIDTVGKGNKPELYSIRINRSGNFGAGLEYWLTSSKEINWQTRFGAQLIAKVKFGGTTIVKLINWAEGLDPLMGESEFSPSQYPITIEFYFGIRNITNASQAQGAIFQFENGSDPNNSSGPNLGSFKIQYRNNLNTNNYRDIPFETGNAPLPFFAIDYNVGSDGFLNGDAIDTTWDAVLNIDQTSTGTEFDLYNGLSTGVGALVGVAKVTLDGYRGYSGYGVHITFADSRNGNGEKYFYLKHEDVDSFIPFTLYLAGDELHNGLATTWAGLKFPSDTNHKDIYAKVESQIATSKVAGNYLDTITVTISPFETL